MNQKNGRWHYCRELRRYSTITLENMIVRYHSYMHYMCAAELRMVEMIKRARHSSNSTRTAQSCDKLRASKAWILQWIECENRMQGLSRLGVKGWQPFDRSLYVLALSLQEINDKSRYTVRIVNFLSILTLAMK